MFCFPERRRGFGIAWVLIGLVITALVGAIFAELIFSFTETTNDEEVKLMISEIRGAVSSFCINTAGEENFISFSVPKDLRWIQVVQDQSSQIEEPDEVAWGSRLCYQMDRGDPICVQLDCGIYMQKITYPDTLAAILAEGKPIPVELTMQKDSCGIIFGDSRSNLHFSEGCFINFCPFKILSGCDRTNPVIVQQDNVTLVGDTTPVYRCCQSDELRFLTNLALTTPGDSIGVFYEDTCVLARELNGEVRICEPMLGKYDKLRKAIEAGGKSISFLRTRTGISNINQYDQIWLLRPGWCEGTTENGALRRDQQYCKSAIAWTDDAIAALADRYRDGVSFVITSDISKDARAMSVVNEILNQTIPGISFAEDSCKCGCGQPFEVEFLDHPLFEGVDSLTFAGAAPLVCAEAREE